MILPILIHNEEPFTVNKRAFFIGASESGYTLKCNPKYSGEGEIVAADWTEYEDGVVGANETASIECPANLWWMLSGNTSDVYVRF